DPTPRPRFWRSTKWAAGALFALVLLAWVASTSWSLSWTGAGCSVNVNSGSVTVLRFQRFRGNDWSIRKDNRDEQRWWFNWSLGRATRAKYITIPLWAIAL